MEGTPTCPGHLRGKDPPSRARACTGVPLSWQTGVDCPMSWFVVSI